MKTKADALGGNVFFRQFTRAMFSCTKYTFLHATLFECQYLTTPYPYLTTRLIGSVMRLWSKVKTRPTLYHRQNDMLLYHRKPISLSLYWHSFISVTKYFMEFLWLSHINLSLCVPNTTYSVVVEALHSWSTIYITMSVCLSLCLFVCPLWSPRFEIVGSWNLECRTSMWPKITSTF